MYQIVLYENYKKVKVLHTYSRLYYANNRLEVLKNKNYLLPKKYIYRDKKLSEVNYKIYLFNKKEDGDQSMVIRDNYGRILDNIMSEPGWVVIGESDYQIEEQFNVTGANRKLSALEIINHVLLPNISKENTKQVLMLNNKLIVEGLHLHMITCKNKEECVRLYNVIRKHCFDKKIGNILFFGSIEKSDRKLWYKKIHSVTGVGYNRLYRSSSR